jgi:hypothetical protein
MEEPKPKNRVNSTILNVVLIVGGIIVLAMVAVIVAAVFVVGSIVSTETKAREEAIQIAYEGRVDLTLAQRKQCRDAKADRDEIIAAYNATIDGSSAIAADPFQSSKTRDARRAEADRLADAVTRLKLRTGENLDCEEWAPDPRRPEGAEKDSRL